MLGVMRRNIRKPGYISEVKSALSEFMQYGIGTKDVEKLCEYASKRNVLAYKLKDLHLLYEGFLNYINERYITTEETLDILRKVLPRSKVVRGSVIVFDGFTGFTPVQYNVIQELMMQAQEVIVTVTMGVEENAYIQDGEQKLFYLSKKTIQDLDRLSREVGVRREKDIRIMDTVVHRYRRILVCHILSVHFSDIQHRSTEENRRVSIFLRLLHPRRSCGKSALKSAG